MQGTSCTIERRKVSYSKCFPIETLKKHANATMECMNNPYIAQRTTNKCIQEAAVPAIPPSQPSTRRPVLHEQTHQVGSSNWSCRGSRRTEGAAGRNSASSGVAVVGDAAINVIPLSRVHAQSGWTHVDTGEYTETPRCCTDSFSPDQPHACWCKWSDGLDELKEMMQRHCNAMEPRADTRS